MAAVALKFEDDLAGDAVFEFETAGEPYSAIRVRTTREDVPFRFVALLDGVGAEGLVEYWLEPYKRGGRGDEGVIGPAEEVKKNSWWQWGRGRAAPKEKEKEGSTSAAPPPSPAPPPPPPPPPALGDSRRGWPWNRGRKGSTAAPGLLDESSESSQWI